MIPLLPIFAALAAGLPATPGPLLVEQLTDPSTRSQAFYELWRRSDDSKDAGYESFLENHYSPKIVVCPQGPDTEPITIVLYGFLSRKTEVSEGDYAITDPASLFPEAATADHEEINRPAIEAFTANGRRIEPFGGDNVLDGELTDLNGDGLIERVEITRCHVEGFKNVEVLKIDEVQEQPTTLLAVLLNFGADEWSYRTRDSDGDGIFDIDLGPQTADGILPKATYRWDADRQSYVGPDGAIEDHFVRLDPDPAWDRLRAIAKREAPFPPDPDYVAPKKFSFARVTGTSSSTAPKPAPPPAEPYEPVDLDALSDEDLLHRMGPGLDARDFERLSNPRSHTPADFWTTTPKAAALKLVESNRSEAHRAAVSLAIDDRTAGDPPDSGTILLSVKSSRCYNAIDWHYFLRVDPDDSYLAYARTWAGGVVFYSFVFNQPAFDLRLCRLPYQTAKHLADTIWWLNRVRSLDSTFGDRLMSSTADGTSLLTVRDATGTQIIDRTETRWSGELSERFDGNYDHEAFANFSAYLLTNALPDHLGAAWTDQEPSQGQSNIFRQDQGPQYPPAELKHLGNLSNQFLTWYSPGSDFISTAIANAAVTASGTLGFKASTAELGRIHSLIPAPLEELRDQEVVRQEWLAALEESRTDSDAKAKADELLAEYRSIEASFEPQNPSALRTATSIAIRKLEVFDDPVALLAWATKKTPGCQWALQRLADTDQPRYLEVLEWWLDEVDGDSTRQIFETIRRLNPARAARIAAARPPSPHDPLAIDAFSALGAAEQLEDQTERLVEILSLLCDPEADSQQRRDAITILVPFDDPLRRTDPEIDDALLLVLNPEQKEARGDYVRPAAAQALARRGNLAAFPAIETLLHSTTDSYAWSRVLNSLSKLALLDPDTISRG